MMNNAKGMSKDVVNSPLGKRLAILIVMFSSCFTLLTTSVQLALDYYEDINRIEQQFQNIQSSYLQAITLSVWSLNSSQIDTQLSGLSNLPDIEYVSILIEGQVAWKKGENISDAVRVVEFPLTYNIADTSPLKIGILRVSASIDNIYKRLIQKAWVILASNGVKTFIVSGFILILVSHLITRHLKTISDYIENLKLDNLAKPLKLDKKLKSKKNDEIDHVAQTLNHMRTSLSTSYLQLSRSQSHLEQLVVERDKLLETELHYKENLESLVHERTHQLETSLMELKSAQRLLVENEKMAALGNMVAGVAHEINTPIGVCRTAASLQSDGSRNVRQKLEDGNLTQTDLKTFLDDIDQSSLLFEQNIIKASKLISSFKKIATDQSYDIKQHFNLHDYFESSVQTIYPQFKKKNIQFHLDIPKNIELDSYPGAFHQMLSNLINNSILHGFEPCENGNIFISAQCDDNNLVLFYSDDGRGLSEEESKKIFEPFFTTTRGHGGTGLGMSIVFNIVNHQLKGSIELLDDGTPGFKLKVTCPLTAEDKSTVV